MLKQAGNKLIDLVSKWTGYAATREWTPSARRGEHILDLKAYTQLTVTVVVWRLDSRWSKPFTPGRSLRTSTNWSIRIPNSVPDAFGKFVRLVPPPSLIVRRM